MEAVNFSNISVGEDGRVIFSGLSSGIDAKGIVDNIILAKRIPIDSIETRIDLNTEKIAALGELRTLLGALKDSLAKLRGTMTVGSTSDIFAAKQAFATTSRTDGATPSAAANLVGVSVTNAATSGSHTIEVLRAATAHKVASNGFTSQTTALSLAGSFELTGNDGSATITVASTDTLQDIRDRINNANTGSSATGVSASIVQASATDFILVLTSDDTGVDMVITDTGSVLSGLGISTTNGEAGNRNGLIAAESKIEATNDGFKQIAFDGTQADNTYLISYDQASKVLTLTRGDGTTDTVTLATAAIDSGTTETARFSDFGVNIVLDSNFSKTTDILIDANTASITGGNGAITGSTITISDSTGDISGITSKTLTFGALGTPTAITVTSGSFSGTFDGTSTGSKTVTLSDGSGNTLEVTFTVATEFDGNESAASIDLQEMENLVAATGSPFSNQLQTSQTARFTADGLLDQDRYESHFISSSSSTLATLAPLAGSPGSFKIAVGSGTVTVNYLSTDTLSGLVTKINSAITAAGGGNAVYDAGTAASIVTDGTGVRMVITNTSGAAITLTDTNAVLAGLGVDNNLVIERASNTISDLFGGITLSLFQAEEGTQIKIDVERDLGSAKTEILAVIEAYNAVKTSLNEHSLVDPETGLAGEDTGVLFGTSILGTIESGLSKIMTQSVLGVTSSFSGLAQIGIELIDRNQEDFLLDNTIVVDETKLDAALLNNPDDIRRLFAFDFSSSDARVSLLQFTGKTSFNTSGYTLNLNYDDRYTSDTITDATAFTQVDAQTGGPASDGISAIVFADTLATGKAFRYSYDSTTEQFTLYNLTAGTSEVIDITSALDAVVDPGGSDLTAGETASVNFPTLGVTLTLSGDSGFTRGSDIANGTLSTAALDANTTMTGGSVTLPTSGIDKATIDSLISAGAYNATTGLLTLGVTSTGTGEAHFDLATGIKFRIDGGSILTDITAVDLDDASAHTVDIYVNDGSSDVMVGTISFTTLASTLAGSGSLTVDLGTGLFGETSAVTSKSGQMDIYKPSMTSGSFEVYDSSNTLLGTVSYSKTDSLLDLASNITENVTDVAAVVVSSGGTFTLEITHTSNDTLSFTELSGNVIAQLSVTDKGDSMYSANVGGAAGGANDGTATVSGDTVKITSTSGAEGLMLLYTGGVDIDSVTVNFTTGFANNLFFELDKMLDPTSGLINAALDTLTGQNTISQDRVSDMLARLELQRQNLLARFITLETVLASAKNLQASLAQSIDAMFASQAR
ncbi:MAG: hypothetical protein E2O52_07175 [Gammaproteobacteria bacterium]|nr:MAG: hypothetical protein E2O52_07175 [Gammaproteobacteria bacterium]